MVSPTIALYFHIVEGLNKGLFCANNLILRAIKHEVDTPSASLQTVTKTATAPTSTERTEPEELLQVVESGEER